MTVMEKVLMRVMPFETLFLNWTVLGREMRQKVHLRRYEQMKKE